MFNRLGIRVNRIIRSVTVHSAAWSPIEPLSLEEKQIDVEEFSSLARVWMEARRRLESEQPQQLEEFYVRLRRSWAIETGILENLYYIDRNTTKTLIDRGFYEELISDISSEQEPARVLAMLRDHLSAGDMLEELTSEERPLTTGFIKELQAVLTQNQAATEAVDSLGRAVKVQPVRGEWKTQPNWRQLSSGENRYFCPPEQVQGQMDDLITYLAWHQEEGVNVAILAAWLHHRFTYIHPFQDGNGRVARALVNYIFVKAGLFPAVVKRDEKLSYLDALEAADNGDLRPLVSLLATKQTEAIKQALSLTETAEEVRPTTLLAELGRGIVSQRKERMAAEQQEYRRVTDVLVELTNFAERRLPEHLAAFAKPFTDSRMEVSYWINVGGSHDDRDYWYKTQIIETAEQANKWANFNEESRWVRTVVRSRTTGLRFVMSFHHVGRTLTGVAEVTCFADLREQSARPADPTERDWFEEYEQDAVSTPVPCMERPFSFTWQDRAEDLYGRFEEWMVTSLAVALKEWARRIV
jgi:Fic family protein